MKIKLSKSQWEFIGKKAGWMKKASSVYRTCGLEFTIDLYGRHYRATQTTPEEFPKVNVIDITIVDRNKLFDCIYESSGFLNTFEKFANQLKGQSNIPDKITIRFAGLLITLVLSKNNPLDLSQSNLVSLELADYNEFESSSFIQNIISSQQNEMYEAASVE